MSWHYYVMNVRTIIATTLILASFQTSAATLTGKVVKVADGDVIIGPSSMELRE